jgi:hypothetical protein
MRLSLIAIVIFAGSATAAAQEREFGAKAGPGFSMLAFEPDESGGYDRRIAADGGGFIVLPLAPRVALQLEALFTAKGAKLYDPDQELTGSIVLHYFDLPVLVRIQGARWGSGSFHVFGGPYAAFRLSAKREVSTTAGLGRRRKKTSAAKWSAWIPAGSPAPGSTPAAGSWSRDGTCGRCRRSTPIRATDSGSGTARFRSWRASGSDRRDDTVPSTESDAPAARTGGGNTPPVLTHAGNPGDVQNRTPIPIRA